MVNQSRSDEQPAGHLERLRDRWRTAWRRLLAWCLAPDRCGLVMTIVLALTACNSAAGAPDATASTCPGSISLTWTVVRGDGTSADCSQVGAQSVALRLQPRAGGAPSVAAFPCSAPTGVANVPPGLYDVTVDLHDAMGTKLAPSASQSVSVVVGRTKALTPVTFEVGQKTDRGNLLFSLRALPFTSNCSPAVGGGAAITSSSIALEDSAGNCISTTLVRSIGGARVGTYDLSCASPAATTCIEMTEALIAPMLSVGRYTAHVRGRLSVNPNECWRADSVLTVPTPGSTAQVVDLTLQPAPC